jgi:hypothetical protein
LDVAGAGLANKYRLHLAPRVPPLEEVETLADDIVLDVLQIVYNFFREHGGEWPTFDYVERWLSLHKRLDATDVVLRIPPALMKPMKYVDGRPAADAKMILLMAGVKLCRGSDDDVDNFVSAVQRIGPEEARYDPGGKHERRMPIAPLKLADALRLPLASDANSVNRLMALLHAEGLVSNGEHG